MKILKIIIKNNFYRLINKIKFSFKIPKIIVLGTIEYFQDVKLSKKIMFVIFFILYIILVIFLSKIFILSGSEFSLYIIILLSTTVSLLIGEVILAIVTSIYIIFKLFYFASYCIADWIEKSIQEAIDEIKHKERK